MGARNETQGQFVATDTSVSALRESASRDYIANLCLLFSNPRKGRLHYIRPVGQLVSRQGVWYFGLDTCLHTPIETILVSKIFSKSVSSLSIVSHFGLHTGLETILVPKTVSRSGLVTLCQSVGWLVGVTIYFPSFSFVYQIRTEKNKDQNSNIWDLHCLLGLVYAGFLLLTSWITRNINSLFLLSYFLLST